MNNSAKSDSSVVLFVFNRPSLTGAVLRKIESFNPSRLYVFGDGPRLDRPEDRDLVSQVRATIGSYRGTGSVIARFSDVNLGLRERFTSGLNLVFSECESAIILEDDCIPDETFFRFCTEMLEHYKDNPSIGVVSGNNFCHGNWLSDASFEFSPMPRTWGWATWQRTWSGFDTSLPNFDLDAAYSYGLKIFGKATLARRWAKTVNQARHSNSIWDHQFVYHLQERALVSAYPKVNLVQNSGFGLGATHTYFESFSASVPAQKMPFPLHFPESVKASGWILDLERAATRKIWLRRLFTRPVDLLMRFIRYYKIRLRI